MKSLARRCSSTPVSRNIFDNIFISDLNEIFKPLWNDISTDREKIFDVFNNSAKYPKVEARQTDKGLELDLAVPGCEKGDINILFEDGILTVKYEKTDQKKSQNGARVLFNELRRSSWNRAWTVVDEVVEKDISASLKNGILTVSIPLAKPQKPKPRKIAIIDDSPDDIKSTESKDEE